MVNVNNMLFKCNFMDQPIWPAYQTSQVYKISKTCWCRRGLVLSFTLLKMFLRVMWGLKVVLMFFCLKNLKILWLLEWREGGKGCWRYGGWGRCGIWVVSIMKNSVYLIKCIWKVQLLLLREMFDVFKYLYFTLHLGWLMLNFLEHTNQTFHISIFNW